jgi:hypothetical protein
MARLNLAPPSGYILQRAAGVIKLDVWSLSGLHESQPVSSAKELQILRALNARRLRLLVKLRRGALPAPEKAELNWLNQELAVHFHAVTFLGPLMAAQPEQMARLLSVWPDEIEAWLSRSARKVSGGSDLLLRAMVALRTGMKHSRR